MPQPVRERLLWELRFERGADAGAVGERDLVEIDGMAGSAGLRELVGAPVPGGRYPPFEGRNPWPADRDLWSLLRERDRLVHHPYERLRRYRRCASSPRPRTIPRWWRSGSRSTAIGERSPDRGGADAGAGARQGRGDLRRAQGAVRRDAQRRLGAAAGGGGATVVYGVVGLKNHAKVGLVVRREDDGLRRYVHIGTGNYNAATATLLHRSLRSSPPTRSSGPTCTISSISSPGPAARPADASAGSPWHRNRCLPWLLEPHRAGDRRTRAPAGPRRDPGEAQRARGHRGDPGALSRVARRRARRAGGARTLHAAPRHPGTLGAHPGA